MRILLVTDDFLPRVGGVSTMMHQLAEAFVQAGAQCAVIAPRIAGTMPIEPSYPIFWQQRTAPPESMSRFQRLRTEHNDAVKFLHHVVGQYRPDLIFLGTHYYYGGAALEVGCQTQTPVALYGHGLDLRSALCTGASPLKRAAACVCRIRTYRQEVEHIVRRADYLFANSQYTASLFRDLGVHKTVCVTGCGLDIERLDLEQGLTPEPDAVVRAQRRVALGLPSLPAVGYLGRLTACKNAGILVDAVARTEGCQLVVVGDGPDRADLQTRIQRAGLADRAHLIGQVDEERKWAYLRSIDVLCLPSKPLANGAVEGFGIVLLEAAAAGAAVVAANTGGMADVVEHGVTGLLCNPDDAIGVSDSLSRLLNDQVFAHRCIQTLRQRVRDRFNWDAVVARIMEWFSSHAPSCIAPPSAYSAQYIDSKLKDIRDW